MVVEEKGIDLILNIRMRESIPGAGCCVCIAKCICVLVCVCERTRFLGQALLTHTHIPGLARLTHVRAEKALARESERKSARARERERCLLA